ncbi:MAG: YccF domain-containing protein [Chloroflexota bacterium]
MSLIGNMIWLIFGGFITGMGYILGGILVCITIVGIPFGRQAIKLGTASMVPFGKEIVVLEEANEFWQMVANIIWAMVLGWELAVAHLVHALILAITIVGLPFAKQHIKLIPVALFPFGRELR